MSRIPSVGLAALVAATLAVACGDTTTPDTPFQPGPQNNSEPPSPKPVLSGVVVENIGTGKRPLANALVYAVDFDGGAYGWIGFDTTMTDRDGRFRIVSRLPNWTVSVLATPPAGRSDLFQPCALTPTLDQDLDLEIELVGPGIVPSFWESPFLSGTVYEQGSKGTVPAAHMPIEWRPTDRGGLTHTQTDSEGRYTLCSIPPSRGQLWPACLTRLPVSEQNEAAPTLEVHGDTTFDVQCPAAE